MDDTARIIQKLHWAKTVSCHKGTVDDDNHTIFAPRQNTSKTCKLSPHNITYTHARNDMSHKQAQPSSPPASSENSQPKTKTFLLVSKEMVEISSYLDRVAFVESFDRPIKVDDVSTILAWKAKCHGSWTTRQLAPNEFFMAFPDKPTIQALVAQDHIRGDGFTLIVNH